MKGNSCIQAFMTKSSATRRNSSAVSAAAGRFHFPPDPNINNEAQTIKKNVARNSKKYKHKDVKHYLVPYLF